MNQICRDIFRAIHEGKWLKIEYRNKADQVTKYWIGIRDLDPRSRTMKVDGLHLGQLTIGEYDRIFIDSILSTEIIEGTYCPENKILVEDLYRWAMPDGMSCGRQYEPNLQGYFQSHT